MNRTAGFRIVNRLVVAGLAIGVLGGASTAWAQSSDDWEVAVAPLYLWTAQMSGDISVGPRTTPVYLSFGDAASKLSGVLTFHVEARRNKWGVLADFGYVHLSTDWPKLVATLPTPANLSGKVDLSNLIFEAGGSYAVNHDRSLSIIGGLRTYTLAPTITFSAASTTIAPVDQSRTSTYGFAGLLYRPKLSDKWTLNTRGDVGGGDGLTWSATAALQFDFSRHGGILFGYRALGVRAGDVATPTGLAARSADTAFDMTHAGPLVALNLRWGNK